jgi:lysophospholipase L1-like esterase
MTPIRIEAEDMNLTGYRIESGNSAASAGELISLFNTGNSTGTASFTFGGVSGSYEIVLGYFDENDGTSSLQVNVGGTQYDVSLNQNLGKGWATSDTRVSRTLTTNLFIEQGQTISITGNVDQAEFARVDYLEFLPIDTAPAPSNPGTLNFSNSNFSVNEDGTFTQAVTIERTGGSDGAVGVTLTPTGGTASASSDFNSNPITVNFAAGETQKTVTIPIVNDTVVENSETINLALSNPIGGATLGGQTTAVLTIADNDTVASPPPQPTNPIRIEAEAMNLTGYRLESGTPASGQQLITLFNTGSNQGTATTQFNGVSGIYDVVLGYFDESDGQAELSVNIGTYQSSFVLNQNLGSGAVSSKNLVRRTVAAGLQVTQGETINILGTVNQAEFARVDYIEFLPTNGTPTPATNPGTLAFSSSNFSVNENGTVVQAVTIERTGGSDGAVSATLTPTSGTASAPSDFNGNPITVNFANGETQKTVTIPIVDDTVVENSETINLALSNPIGGATLGTQKTAVLTIADNDIVASPSPQSTNPIRIEAEAMNLTGYRLESGTPASGQQLITLFDTGSNQGTATTQFNGASGTYDVVLGYFDESDGQAELSVNIGTHQSSFVLNQNLGSGGVSSSNLVRRTVATGLQVTQGETINILGTVNQAEFARVDYIEFLPTTDGTTVINGSAGSETLTGNARDNTIRGYGGNDILIGGGGNNILDGGAGIDTVSYAQATSGVVVNLDTGVAIRKFATSPDTPFKIMPLGDSNTRGKGSDPAGYRNNLWDLLQGDGFNIDFVGSQSTGFNSFDDNHEGHGGWTIPQIAGSVNGWLNSYQPDGILLMIGTNDTGSGTLSQMTSNLNSLIDQITNQSPNARLFVASLPPNTTTSSRTQLTIDFNAEIPDIVDGKAAQGKNVTFVDVFGALSTSDILSDGLHPTPDGYTKIAEVWHDAIANSPSGEDSLIGIENVVGSSYDDVLTGNAGDNQFTGGAGRDTFVLAEGGGIDTIADFSIGYDWLGLSGNLTFDRLTISQGTGTNANDTLINLADNNELLAILSGVQANALGASAFTTV